MTFRWLQVPGDCSAVYNIRVEVFVKEQGFSREFDATDAVCHHLLCEVDGVPAGCARIFPDREEGRWHIGRVAILPAFRGTGLGLHIMNACHEKIAELGGNAAVLSAQCQAIGFYQKAGYQIISGEYLDEHCPHVDMLRQIP